MKVTVLYNTPENPEYKKYSGAVDLTEVRHYWIEDNRIELEFADSSPLTIEYDEDIIELLDNHFEAKIEAEMHDNADDAKWEIISDVFKRFFGKRKK